MVKVRCLNNQTKLAQIASRQLPNYIRFRNIIKESSVFAFYAVRDTLRRALIAKSIERSIPFRKQKKYTSYAKNVHPTPTLPALNA